MARCSIKLSLRQVLSSYVSHFHTERNHQGKDSVILFPAPADRIGEPAEKIRTRERLGGLLNSTTGKPHERFDRTGSSCSRSHSRPSSNTRLVCSSRLASFASF